MSLLGSVAPLAVVLLLLGAVLWWLRRSAGRLAASGRHIRVIETIELGPGRCLHLIELAGRALLVASTAQRCDLLCEMESVPAEVAAGEQSLRSEMAAWWSGRWGKT